MSLLIYCSDVLIPGEAVRDEEAKKAEHVDSLHEVPTDVKMWARSVLCIPRSMMIPFIFLMLGVRLWVFAPFCLDLGFTLKLNKKF